MKKTTIAAVLVLSFAAFGTSSCSNPDGTDGFKESMDSKPNKTKVDPNPGNGDTTQDYETNYPHDTVPQ